MSYKILRKNIEEICRIAGLISQRGWAEGNAGNISFNISEYVVKKINLKNYKVNKFKKTYLHLKENFILVTASGIKMNDLILNFKSSTLVIYILNDGRSFIKLSLSDLFSEIKSNEFNNVEPTSELLTHLAVHNYLNKNKRKEKFLLHTHPTEIIALTQIKEFTKEKNINRLLWKMHPEVKIFLPKGVGLIKYCLPGSENIARLTVKSFENHQVVIWEKHGCLSIGEKISKAFDLTDIITKSIKIFFLCKSAGFKPEGLKESELLKLNKLASKYL
ncbi:MAG: rhamnulose-1-phosphate aldolase [Ignavibacteria bacterium]|nr:rhamnulose-1-phosphate aldolase [Ignavibacteria bacterium]